MTLNYEALSLGASNANKLLVLGFISLYSLVNGGHFMLPIH